MKVKTSNYTDISFFTLVARMEGEVEMLKKQGTEIISVNITGMQGRFYGAIFYVGE